MMRENKHLGKIAISLARRQRDWARPRTAPARSAQRWAVDLVVGAGTAAAAPDAPDRAGSFALMDAVRSIGTRRCSVRIASSRTTVRRCRAARVRRKGVPFYRSEEDSRTHPHLVLGGPQWFRALLVLARDAGGAQEHRRLARSPVLPHWN